MDTAYTGNQIATRRKKLGMTQKELAEKLHVTDKAVSKWERGINFPDLGLMEALASALEATPASLLGLEEANRDEIVTSMTEISQQQLEDSLREVKWLGWFCVLAAALLTAAYFLYGKNVRHTQIAYMMLTCVIVAAAVCGLWLLVKYGQIKRFDIPEIIIFYGIFFSILIFLGIQFFTGSNPTPVLGFCLIAAASVLTQLLFYRIMVPGIAKALPLILTAAFALWRIPQEFPFDVNVLIFALPALCSLVVWSICFFAALRTGKVRLFSARQSVLISVIILLLVGILFYHPLVQTYVHLRHDHLQQFADTLLTESADTTSRKYGVWKVTAFPKDNMVEFHIGGYGLAPSSTYIGFYYSAEDAHTPFLGMDVPMQTNGTSAQWTDGTDNWGKSTRLREKWFWFEAHF